MDKGKRFRSKFIQPGLAGYPGDYGNVLVSKNTLDQSLATIIGAPVLINHDKPDNVVGVISNAWYNEQDGWYWCEGVIWDETAQNLVSSQNWSVSCSYDFLEEDCSGGTENNIPYDREFTKLDFAHLAIVSNPRYERANIVFNARKDDTDMSIIDDLKKLISKFDTQDEDVENEDVEIDQDEDDEEETTVENSKDGFFERLNDVYNAAMMPPKQDMYICQADRLKAGEEYFK